MYAITPWLTTENLSPVIFYRCHIDDQRAVFVFFSITRANTLRIESVSSIVPWARDVTGWPMQSEARRIQATIADLAAITSDVARLADVAASTWREINAVLSPIIGPGGVAALYQRSLYMTRDAHPCLAGVREDAQRPVEFVALQLVLSQQSASYGVAANGALLQTFCDLLANLVGASLTERLLRSVRNLPTSGAAGQDTSA